MKVRKHDSQEQKRPRSKNEKGLPDAKAREDLARTYLEAQRRLWPELVKQGVLPRATKANIARMADKFKQTFLSGKVSVFSVKGHKLWESLAAAYLRYSDDNSNPRSLDQQLRNVLERAVRDKAFIPWEYVCADAAVTGTIANRRGYQMIKALIQREGGEVEQFYIDEVGRASRNAIESLQLGQLIDHYGKRLIGVSDSFDSANPQSKLMLGIFAMLHEWFIDQLRSKVNRGMDDAFERGSNIHGAATGYRLEQATDQHGNPIFDPKDGEHVNVKVINEEGAKWVRKAFELYAIQRWSRQRIGRLFNQHQVDGKQTWDSTRIKQLLTRETYVGRECYRMTRRVSDPESGKVTIERRPREEWSIREVPHLRIISDELWDQTQQRRQECGEAYAKNGRKGPNRTEIYPTTLFRPICGSCGNPLMLGRSGKYASFCCLNGIYGKHKCNFKGYKSLRIIETSILNYLRDHVFTAEFLETVIRESNSALARMAKEPKEDVQPILRAIKSEKKKLDRLRKIVVKVGEDKLPSIVDDLCDSEERLMELQAAKAAAAARNEAPPRPLTQAEIPALLKDLHGLLNEEVGTAAPLLRELTGPIVVQQTKEKSKRGKAWVAHFTVNAVAVIAKLSASGNCPTGGSLEYLNTRGWTIGKEVTVKLGHTPKYERIAAKVEEMSKKGASVETIGRALGTTWGVVQAALTFTRTGKRPYSRPQRKRRIRRGPPKAAQYVALSPQVAQLRDGKRFPFAKIAKQLKIHQSTATRAYDYAHQEALQRAAEKGQTPQRGRYSHISADVHEQIRRELKRGKLTVKEIAVRSGVGTSTVHREKYKLNGAQPETPRKVL